jgi:hypothetical protein
VTEYTQTRLWDPLEMEYGDAWALDSDQGFIHGVDDPSHSRRLLLPR